MYYTQRDGKVRSNIKEIPYGEQSQILYEDYNFDGVPDLALMDGQNSQLYCKFQYQFDL